MHVYLPTAETGLLADMGVLRGAERHDHLTAEAIQLFAMVASAREEGIPRNRIPAKYLADTTTALLPLELAGWVCWEYDKRGNPSFLTITWKGEEALNHARVCVGASQKQKLPGLHAQKQGRLS